MVPIEATKQQRRRPRAVIASGAGRYADPWHPFAETSPLVADILRADGWDAEIIANPDAALASLESADLLVVNAGDPWRNAEARRGTHAEAAAGLDAALAHGTGLLALHCALASLRDYPAWRAAIGGEWKDGHSWHPKIGEAQVRAGGDRALVAADFTLFDERYTDLVIDDGVAVHAVHDEGGTAHPIIWTREVDISGTRVCAAVSALGHDARAYASPEYRAILGRLARWAARGGPGIRNRLSPRDEL